MKKMIYIFLAILLVNISFFELKVMANDNNYLSYLNNNYYLFNNGKNLAITQQKIKEDAVIFTFSVYDMQTENLIFTKNIPVSAKKNSYNALEVNYYNKNDTIYLYIAPRVRDDDRLFSALYKFSDSNPTDLVKIYDNEDYSTSGYTFDQKSYFFKKNDKLQLLQITAEGEKTYSYDWPTEDIESINLYQNKVHINTLQANKLYICDDNQESIRTSNCTTSNWYNGAFAIKNNFVMVWNKETDNYDKGTTNNNKYFNSNLIRQEGTSFIYQVTENTLDTSAAQLVLINPDEIWRINLNKYDNEDSSYYYNYDFVKFFYYNNDTICYMHDMNNYSYTTKNNQIFGACQNVITEKDNVTIDFKTIEKLLKKNAVKNNEEDKYSFSLLPLMIILAIGIISGVISIIIFIASNKDGDSTNITRKPFNRRTGSHNYK